MAWSPPVAALTFLKYDRVIQVDSPETAVTIQDLINQIRDYEDELDFMDYAKIANAYGKQDLGSGSQVGITLELVNNWRIQFEARSGPSTELMTVSGGNLVAVNDYDNNPIKPSAFTQVTIAQSTSPSIATPESDYHLMYLIENLQGTHKSVGNIFYWDPENGDDSNSGTTPDTAVASFSQAHSLCTDANHDIIFALAKDTSGTTTVTDETIAITKDNVKLRGPGFSFQIVPAATGSSTVTVAATGVEVTGFYIESGSTDNGITVTGNNVLIKDCWVANTGGHGIDISGATRPRIETCAIENSGQGGTYEGINLGNSVSYSLIKKNIITGASDDGIHLSGTSMTDNIFENNLIYNNGGYGVNIGSGATRTGVRGGHTFSGNTSGDTQDNGSASFIEAPSSGASASDIADAVWDELITDHVAANSTGKTLKDAKTRATLASLK